MASVEIDAHHLPECSYCFFASMSKIFKEDFQTYLKPVVERLFHSCNLQETEISGEDDDNLAVDEGIL